MKDKFITETTFDGDYDLLDEKFVLVKKIGDGATSNVYLAKNKSDNKISAIKILKTGNSEKHKNNYKHFLREMEMLKKVDQKNIINITDGKSGGLLKKTDSSTERVDYISLELAENGELFDYIYFPKKGFGENFGRFIFKEMMNGLNACHRAGVVHRDLKTENIMMTKDFVLKIADFGYATLKIGRDNNNLLDSFLGTLSYAAPEILSKRPYYGEAADVFSSGVILFVLVTGKLPFSKAHLNDDDYREIATKDLESFWFKKNNKIGQTTEDFKSLVSLMLAHDPLERPNVSEILEHPWFKLNMPTQEEMNDEFNRRDKIVKQQKAVEQMEEERKQEEIRAQERKKNSQRKKGENGPRVYRDGNTGEFELLHNEIEYTDKSDIDENLESTIKNYIGFNNFKILVKNISAAELLEKLISFFYNSDGDKDTDKRKKLITVNENEFELSVKYKHDKKLLESIPDIKLQELEVKAEIKALEGGKDHICEFFKYKGDKMEFLEVFDRCIEYFKCDN